MKKISLYVKAGGNINWNHTLKEVIFPLYLRLRDLDYLETDLEIHFASKINYLILWEETFKYIFPKITFYYLGDHFLKTPTISINLFWCNVHFIMNPELYNLGIKKSDIDSFNQYLEDVIPKPEVEKNYDIILIKRRTGVNSSYYTDSISKDNQKALKGIIPAVKYIKNSSALYKAICQAFPDKKVWHLDLVDLNFPERFHYFRNISMLIGQHGAALVQSLFMKDNTTVIEYTNKKYYKSGLTRQICVAKNIQYCYSIYSDPVFQAISVDQRKLIGLMKEILEGKMKQKIFRIS